MHPESTRCVDDQLSQRAALHWRTARVQTAILLVQPLVVAIAGGFAGIALYDDRAHFALVPAILLGCAAAALLVAQVVARNAIIRTPDGRTYRGRILATRTKSYFIATEATAE